MMKIQELSCAISDLNCLLEQYKASKTNQISFSALKPATNETEYEESEYDDEEEEEFDSYPFIQPSERVYLQKWLANSSSWQNKKFGSKFDKGATFRPICGDGNCFFSAISASVTASKEMPLGTATKHNELRQKICDFILKTGQEKKNTRLYRMMMNRKVPLEGKALTAYVARKRSTEGSYDSWSDWFTFEACAAMLDRPVLQVTYPRYVNGKKRPELPPAFYRSYCGSNDKLPVQIHYNGTNHYNTFVPKQLPEANSVGTIEELFENFEECDFKSQTTASSTNSNLKVPATRQTAANSPARLSNSSVSPARPVRASSAAKQSSNQTKWRF